MALFVTPPATLPLLLYPLISDPRLLIEGWDVYLLFFGLPWAAALALLITVRRMERC